MKLVATIALNLVCCTLAAGECTTAGSNKFQPSFDRVRIGVLLNAKAQSNVTLDIAAPVAQAESQQDGAFSGQLPDGEYLAIFTKAWFRPVVMIFEIARKEKARDLRIGMQVQGMSATRSSATRLYLETALH